MNLIVHLIKTKISNLIIEVSEVLSGYICWRVLQQFIVGLYSCNFKIYVLLEFMNLLNLVLLQFVNLSTSSVRIMPINVFDVLSMLINFQSQDNPYFRKIISIEFYLCFCFYFELKDIVLHGSEETQRLGEILRIHIVQMIPPPFLNPRPILQFSPWHLGTTPLSDP